MPITGPSPTLLDPSLSSKLHLRADIITTTIFPDGTPTTTLVFGTPPAPVPVGAIAGGTVAGVLLAVSAVVGWVWWGKCIKRQKAKEKRELLKALEVRENTRRNASSALSTPTGPSPTSTIGKKDRTIKFISEKAPPVPPIPDSFKPVPTAASSPPQTKPANPYAPARPSPLARALSGSRRKSPPASPPGTQSSSGAATPTPRDSGFTSGSQGDPSLEHKSSNLSSSSFYSVQSWEDEPQPVPQSLISAALESPEQKRIPIPNYLPVSRWQTNPEEPSRLSHVSAGSAASQPDSMTGIGYAA
ncbi:hypothetical protein K474DRAFT_1355595 [Panus rudis PR-1116 ss-1]|nr:hypothetical protein K474DRAFT_1355595 [Panus rudis PR-1116 ss-1]